MKAVTERDYSLRIHFTSKSRNLRFRFIASNNANNFFRFSLLITLRQFFLSITSQPTQKHKPLLLHHIHSIKSKKLRFITTKFVNIFHYFRGCLSKKRRKRESSLPYPKDLKDMGFWVMGFLTFMVQSISKKDQKGFMMLASIACFASSLLFNKFKTAKLVSLAALVSVVATIVSYQFAYFDTNYLDYIARSTWNKMERIIGYS